jgi:hypothetical protein
MENLRQKNEIETQNTLDGHSSRLEQAEDRISKLVVICLQKTKARSMPVTMY